MSKIEKPKSSKANATATATANPAVTPEMLAMAMAVFQAAGVMPTTAETPAGVMPKHESSPFYGGKIWIGNASGRIWIDGEVNLDELRKAFKFKADEYKPKTKNK